jgi:segregation and condensation protein A
VTTDPLSNNALTGEAPHVEANTATTEAESSKAPTPQQNEMPFAIVQGQQVTELPRDLYIPPEALEVILDAFEGPLDLLLYLIRRQNLDILDINVADITHQYMSYIELMKAMQWELAAEYLLMAAMLAEIKSRMLLPRQNEDEESDEDPRAELIRRLQEYERFKQAAEDIDTLPRTGRDVFPASAKAGEKRVPRAHPPVVMEDLLLALADVMRRVKLTDSHHIEFEVLSTRERMSHILQSLSGKGFVPFITLFNLEEGRQGVIVTFLAMMELVKESLVEIVQNEFLGPIHLKARAE